MSNTDQNLLSVSICDGKYTIIQDRSGAKVLRYGKEWRDVTGDNVICGAAHEIERLREELAAVTRQRDGLQRANQSLAEKVSTVTREREDAIEARNVIAKNIRAEMILKMQEVARERDEARAEVARLKAGGCARDQRTTQFCAEAVALQERVKRLEREVELLRAYGNKDCTWMADQHLESEKAKEAKP
jgi:hypothetical protein